MDVGDTGDELSEGASVEALWGMLEDERVSAPSQFSLSVFSVHDVEDVAS